MDGKKAKGPGRPRGTRVKLYPRVMAETATYLEAQAPLKGKSVHELAAELLDEIIRDKIG